jgi:hypothetical protein
VTVAGMKEMQLSSVTSWHLDSQVSYKFVYYVATTSLSL